ncbi:MAG: hypothetical protein GY835_09405 [bacterium]|nr:hypothetical protein [bacterium]
MPWIQDDELRVRNAGANLRDQARAQNVTYFLEWDKQKWQQPASMEAVDQLTSSIAGQPTLPVAVQPPPPAYQAEDNRMDMETPEKEKGQDDIAMGDGTGAHESESTENGVAKQA